MANDQTLTKNQKLIDWVNEWAQITTPDSVYWVDGSEEENDRLNNLMVNAGMAVKLDEKKRPNSFYFRSDPTDVARVENRTFICTETEAEAGPTNNWAAPDAMKAEMLAKYKGCMKGRTMYVIPFSMGPLGSDIAHIGVELTDSPYVVTNMRIMTRMGKAVLDVLGETGEFIKCIHSVGAPLAEGQEDVAWPCAPIDEKYISHFAKSKEIWSYGSGYGGNALLGKKCFALRIASVMAKEQGWLAEHMLILGLTNPEGKTKYIAAAFPSACGKTNLAMLVPTIPGWTVKCVGDDIAWMKFGADGQLYAINPEAGFFGVAPGTSMETNANALLACDKNTIFTNVGLTPDGDIWWDGIGVDCPEGTLGWKGETYTKGSDIQVSHPNARFAAPASQCPVIDPEWENPAGVPISAILFGGRRPSTLPLVYEARDWNHGTFMGSIVGSEVTAAAIGLAAGVRRDPFAMLPFMGYNMAEHWGHWVKIGETAPDKNKLPKIFNVNWFRTSEDGRWLWPGFGDNSRVLKWIFERCDGAVSANETPIGAIPSASDIDVSGLKVTDADLAELLDVNKDAWLAEVELINEHYARFGDSLPAEMKAELETLKANLG